MPADLDFWLVLGAIALALALTWYGSRGDGDQSINTATNQSPNMMPAGNDDYWWWYRGDEHAAVTSSSWLDSPASTMLDNSSSSHFQD